MGRSRNVLLALDEGVVLGHFGDAVGDARRHDAVGRRVSTVCGSVCGSVRDAVDGFCGFGGSGLLGPRDGCLLAGALDRR